MSKLDWAVYRIIIAGEYVIAAMKTREKNHDTWCCGTCGYIAGSKFDIINHAKTVHYADVVSNTLERTENA